MNDLKQQEKGKPLACINWLHLGTTENYAELKKDIANVCRDVTEAGCIDEICINDIVESFKLLGYEVVPTENVWFNSTTGEYMSAEAYDDLRCKRIATLEAENEWLRRALESVNYWMHETSPPWPTEQDAASAGEIAEIVSQALKEGK